MADAAVIFDVDGVLLELTDAEAELFFVPFEDHLDANRLSRDWNSYRIRNDENIVEEILELNGLPASQKQHLIDRYINLLNQSLNTQTLVSTPISGAAQLLSQLPQTMLKGIATANFREAAKLRLMAANLWDPVHHYAFGADGGGHKYEIVARAIDSMRVPPHRVVYVGDNINDVEAGLRNGTHFIGFSTDATRREALQAAGAVHLSSNHSETLRLISGLIET